MTQSLLVSPRLPRLLIGCLLALAVQKAAWLFFEVSSSKLTDFHTFYLAGQMALRGVFDQAYAAATFAPAQAALSGGTDFMPWPYPPPFGLVVAGLALLPLPASYLLFIGATLAAYLVMLKRLARDSFPAALTAVFPALVACIGSGQNGCLTGALLGLACVELVRGRTRAGIPIGLMIIKPHLALLVGGYVLVGQRWRVTLLALAVAVLATACATLVFGTQVWPAFLAGAREVTDFLEAGLYPFFRMVSVYALLRSVGASSETALIAQAVVACLALTFVALAWRQGEEPRHVLGRALLVSLSVTPYAYDYDVTVVGLGFGLLLPDLLCRTRPRELAALVALAGVAGGAGIVQTMLFSDRLSAGGSARVELPSIAAAAYLLFIGAICIVLGRAKADMPATPVTAPG
jgi:hypothetical protein